MPTMNNRYQWGAIAIALHWIVFLMVLGLIASGKIPSRDGGPIDELLMSLHAPMGAVLLFVMLTRYFWRLVNPRVGKVDDGVGFAAALTAWVVHNLLYIAIIAQALIGISMSQAGGNDVDVLGWNIPKLLGEGGLLPLEHPALARLDLGETEREARRSLRGLHGNVGDILIGLIALHFLGAMYHRFARRDMLLRRMWFGYTPPELAKKVDAE